MRIKLNFLAQFRELARTSKAEIDVESPYIINVLEEMKKIYGLRIYDEIIQDGVFREDTMLLRNGKITYDLEEKLDEGDELTFLPPAFGG